MSGDSRLVSLAQGLKEAAATRRDAMGRCEHGRRLAVLATEAEKLYWMALGLQLQGPKAAATRDYEIALVENWTSPPMGHPGANPADWSPAMVREYREHFAHLWQGWASDEERAAWLNQPAPQGGGQ